MPASAGRIDESTSEGSAKPANGSALVQSRIESAALPGSVQSDGGSTGRFATGSVGTGSEVVASASGGTLTPGTLASGAPTPGTVQFHSQSQIQIQIEFSAGAATASWATCGSGVEPVWLAGDAYALGSCPSCRPAESPPTCVWLAICAVELVLEAAAAAAAVFACTTMELLFGLLTTMGIATLTGWF
jgi:hypothetical protein